MSGETWLAGILTVAVLIGWIRIVWRPARGAAWRVAALLLLNAAAGALLYCTLLPPRVADRQDRLTIATAGAPRTTALSADTRLVSLPEADDIAGAERAPDLATALRRHPGVGTLRIVGSGLEPRDREAAEGYAVTFDPAPLPRGLTGLYPPAETIAGGAFQVAATVTGVAGGTVELLDPAGRSVDRAEPESDGHVVLGGTARTPGAALFGLRVRDANRAVIEEVAVPIVTLVPPQTRMLIVSGAPGPEVKFLRRWATDAGLVPVLRTAVGGGVRLGDAPALSAASLSRIDVAVFDDRGWAGLSAGEHAAVAAAVRGGMGALLRVTGPVAPSIRTQWRAMGLDVAGGQVTAAVALAPAASGDAALQARRGPGTPDVPPAASGEREDLPGLTRRVATMPGAVPLLRDARGALLAGWKAAGRGRVGAWLVEDGFGLVTAGHGDRYGEWWSQIVSTLARPDRRSVARVDRPAWAGERLAVCDLPPERAAMIDPAGVRATLLPDPAVGGCTGYWPTRPGWHRLVGGGGLNEAVYVWPANALPGVRAADRRATTSQLAGGSARARAVAAPEPRGASWPWFLGWLGICGLCWWRERSSRGR